MTELIKMPFGKYRGETLSDLAKKDGGYLIWVFNQEWTNERLKNQIMDISDEIVLNFGKFSGLELRQIKKKDKWYYDYLFKNELSL